MEIGVLGIVWGAVGQIVEQNVGKKGVEINQGFEFGFIIGVCFVVINGVFEVVEGKFEFVFIV